MKQIRSGRCAVPQGMGRSSLRGSLRRFLLSTALGAVVLATMAGGLAWTSGRGRDASTPEGDVARVTAALLERSQFAHHPLDDELASRFLDRYLDTLDGGHMLFLQSDLDDFALYRHELAHLTRDVGDTSPAHVIFARYLKRLRQQVSYITNQLATADFDFSGHDLYNPDRSSAPRPPTLAAAKQLWLERLRSDYLQELLAGRKPAEIVGSLSNRCQRAAVRMGHLSNEQILGLYLDALAHVYDPHSDYFDPEQMEDFSISMNLRLFGVGATLVQEDGYCTIRDLIPGGPAAHSGQLNPGDRVVAVTQPGQTPVDVVDMPLSQTVQLIRGPKGTPVELTILPEGASGTGMRKQVRLIRDEIRLEEQRARARVLDVPVDGANTVRLGVIDLPSFYGETDDGPGKSGASASEDVRVLLKKLKQEQVQGLVLDLRHNGGGLLDEAVKVTGLFIRQGAVVQTRDANGKINVEKDTDPAKVYAGPLIVLISRMSASASEIVAGALKDYGRALIVGDPCTFGKGTVQSMTPLEPLMRRAGFPDDPEAGALAVTIRKFYRPEGASTQIHGVRSDIVLPSLTDNPKLSEAAQDNPLPWDRVAPQTIESSGMVDSLVGSLREQCAVRLARREDLSALRQAATELRQHENPEPAILNREARAAEAAAQKARQTRWEKELARAQEPKVRVYDITVQEARRPGLPEGRDIGLNAQSFSPESVHATAEAGSQLWRKADGIVLAETERILVDYIHALNARNLPVMALQGASNRTGVRRAAKAASAASPFEQEPMQLVQ